MTAFLNQHNKINMKKKTGFLNFKKTGSFADTKKRKNETPVFKHHYFPINRNIQIRYGIASNSSKPGKAVLLLLHGRAEFLEKYELTAKKLMEKGFRVISLDWRGQGLSSRQLGNPHKGHVNRFEDYVNDLQTFYLQIIEPLGVPVYILAHSMGGHIALRFMARQPLKIKKAALVSPMIDIAFQPGTKHFVKLLSKSLSKTLFAEKYTLGSGNYSFKNVKFETNNLSHDPEKYRILHNEIADNPRLALGGVTWGWLAAALKSIEILKQDDIIEKIITPVLIINAGKDSVVSSRAQKKLSRKLPDSSFVSIKGSFHELLFEKREITDQVWNAVDNFISHRF